MTAPPLSDPIRVIALNYTPLDVRHDLHALWVLDEALGAVVAGTRELVIGQMRLTWWHERLCDLDQGKTVPEPRVQSLMAAVLAGKLSGLDIAGLVEGWEALIDPLPLSQEALAEYARERGGRMFTLAAALMGTTVDPMLGEGWALIDFAGRCGDSVTADRAWTMARVALQGRKIAGPKPLRILARLAAAKANRPSSRRSDTNSRWEILHAVLW